MAPRQSQPDAASIGSLRPFPLSAAHWQGIVTSLRLSRQQTRIVELILRCASQKQIAEALGITEPTLKTYMQRIFVRTGTNSRMQLAMHIFALSHRVTAQEQRHPKR